MNSSEIKKTTLIAIGEETGRLGEVETIAGVQILSKGSYISEISTCSPILEETHRLVREGTVSIALGSRRD
jgi:hypothetical protein